MFGSNSKDSAIKYFKRLGVYKASNVYFDPKQVYATSYDWWCFVKKIKGKVVFNDYYYSQSTSGHQSKVKKVLKDLRIKVDVYVNVRSSLSDLNLALAEKYESLYANHIVLKRKGIRPNTIKYTKQAIESLNKDIKVLRGLGAKYSKEKQLSAKRHAEQTEISRLTRQRAKRKVNGDKPMRSNDTFVKTAPSFELVI